jgi:hypothetical protein
MEGDMNAVFQALRTEEERRLLAGVASGDD